MVFSLSTNSVFRNHRIHVKNLTLTQNKYNNGFKPNVFKRNNWIKDAFNGILNALLVGGEDFGSVYSLQR